MTIPEDFKTRLQIAKSKIKKQLQSDDEKRISKEKEELLNTENSFLQELSFSLRN